jgi:hypothetical protein
MKLSGFSSCALASLLLLIGACGGSAKPSDTPASEPAPTEKSTPADASEAPKADDSSPPKAAEESKPAAKPSAPADDGPKPTKSASDILTAPDVVFLFSFNDSDAKAAAEQKCNAKAGNDPKKLNTCMAAERKSFPPDGHRFKQDEKGQWWWITVRQKGNRLVALHKIPVELGEETPTSVTLKPVGKDKGSAPMVPPAKVVVEVPNDYQIAFKDPKAGRLVFQAKIGVVTE